MPSIEDLFATLALKIDEASWRKGDSRIAGVRRGVQGVGGDAARSASGVGQLGNALASAGKVTTALAVGATGLAAYFGQRLVRSGIAFNSTMEDTKNEIAGMLALSRQTRFVDELGTAGTLVENLRRRAAELPGETSEYVQMLGMIAGPIMDAKLGMKDLEDLTVNAVVAAKGMHKPWEVAARDIEQALRGQFHSVDPFTGRVLGSIGYKGEEGRSRYNALDDKTRASELKRALLQPQFTDMAAAQGKSFSGILSTLADTWHQFEGAVSAALFKDLIETIKGLNAWLDLNKAKVADVAAAVGGALAGAFEMFVGIAQAAGAAIGFFAEHSEFTKSLLIGLASTFTVLGIAAAIAAKATIAAWLAAALPVVLVIAAVTALVYGIRQLVKHWDVAKAAMARGWDAIKSAARDVWEGIKAGFKHAFEFIAQLPVIKSLVWLVEHLLQLSGKQRGPEASAGYVQDMKNMSSPDLRVIDSQRSASTGGRSVTIGQISIGDIQVSSPNADPQAVAVAVREHMGDHLDNIFRESMDALS